MKRRPPPIPQIRVILTRLTLSSRTLMTMRTTATSKRTADVLAEATARTPICHRAAETNSRAPIRNGRCEPCDDPRGEAPSGGKRRIEAANSRGPIRTDGCTRGHYEDRSVTAAVRRVVERAVRLHAARIVQLSPNEGGGADRLAELADAATIKFAQQAQPITLLPNSVSTTPSRTTCLSPGHMQFGGSAEGDVGEVVESLSGCCQFQRRQALGEDLSDGLRFELGEIGS